ncbi:SAVMC3_10250 family protein [Actinoallomurus purpureus]|uniref:DUF7019 family protein n=1 Tax=Actinoallomurus purpureus TaxID=478114 RepID=UPI0020925032|nr:SAVMC3_10250 family protein [Actinoallomurus purpureus]MCO6004504.1 SAVMC3_10250 family protein [Actinoallomurus purpureus]
MGGPRSRCPPPDHAPHRPILVAAAKRSTQLAGLRDDNPYGDALLRVPVHREGRHAVPPDRPNLPIGWRRSRLRPQGDQSQSEDRRHEAAKLAAVEDWIYAHETVGNIDEPREWIYGRMPMAATLMTQAWEAPTPEQRRQSAALFAARSDAGSHLILAGAARHLVLANNLPQVSEHDRDMFSSSITLLMLLLQNYPELREAAAKGDDSRRGANHYLGYLAPAVELLMSGDLDGYVSKHEFEFLAKRVVTATAASGQPPATLATPLFVALAD